MTPTNTNPDLQPAMMISWVEEDRSHRARRNPHPQAVHLPLPTWIVAHGTTRKTSDLHNYAKYADGEELTEEEPGYKYYDNGGPSDENIPGGGVKVVGRHTRDRSSLMSMSGLMDRAKRHGGNARQQLFGHESPIDRVGTTKLAGGTLLQLTRTPPIHEKKGFSLDGITSLFGRKKVDPSSLGPRIIMLNNRPANASNRWVDNHVLHGEIQHRNLPPEIPPRTIFQICQPVLLVYRRPAASPGRLPHESIHNHCGHS